MKELYPWQSETIQRLRGMRARLPNALLLKGPEGIGKLDLALNFAQSILCNSPDGNGNACNQCSSCHWFTQETNPNFKLVQPNSYSDTEEIMEKESGKKASREISIDQIRGLSNFVNLTSHNNGYRIVLIYPAEAMNNNAANALLKSLEEPTDQLMFILVSSNPQQLLPTILSRCLSLALPLPTLEQSTLWLRDKGISDPTIALAQAGFAPLTALKIAAEESGFEEHEFILNSLSLQAGFDAISLADRLQRTLPTQVIHLLQQWCYDLVSFKQVGVVRYYPEHHDSIAKITKNISLQALHQLVKELQEAKRIGLHPLNPKLLFETLFLAYQQTLHPLRKA
jgi:DNA polymerase III subunit delta'